MECATAANRLGCVGSKDAELVAFGISQGRPLEPHLLIRVVSEARGPESDQALDVGLAVKRIPARSANGSSSSCLRELARTTGEVTRQRGPIVPASADLPLECARPESSDLPASMQSTTHPAWSDRFIRRTVYPRRGIGAKRPASRRPNARATFPGVMHERSLPAMSHGPEVRKTVTVVFTDVTGWTTLGESLDPESLRRVMSRYFDEMRRAI